MPLRSNFNGMHDVCAQTGCNLKFYDVTDHLTDQEKLLVVQNRPNPLKQKIYATKTPDGILLHSADGHFFSVLHAKSMFLPKGSPIPPHEIMSQVAVPGQPCPLPIHVSLDHGPCGANTISRLSPFTHVKQKLECLKPLESTPRVIFSSDGLGKLSGTILRGEDSNLIKGAFLALHNHFEENSEDGQGILDRKLKLVPEISQHLMLKDLEGNIELKRCMDGLVGFRKRKSDNGNTFIFVVKSDDIHKDAPTQDGAVQIFKMDYEKKKKKGCAKKRISFLNCPYELDKLAPEFQTQGIVHADMSVQDILNSVAYSFRNHDLSNINCEHFGNYIQVLDEFANAGSSDEE
jgi:hypothetical protein